jgi:hypothetical protein
MPSKPGRDPVEAPHGSRSVPTPYYVRKLLQISELHDQPRDNTVVPPGHLHTPTVAIPWQVARTSAL